MANDIVNATSATTTGNEKKGQITVNTGSQGPNDTKTYDPANMTEVAISVVAAKFDTRFDDPRYYQGDSSS